MKYALFLLALIGLSCNAMDTKNLKAPDSKTINGYAEIAQIIQEAESSTPDAIVVDPKAKIKDRANSLLQLAPEAELKKKVFKLFDAVDQRPFTSIMQSYALREINVLIGDAEDKDLHLLKHVDQTQTLVGKTFLARLIAEPTTSHKTIQERQNALRLLIKDEKNPTLHTNSFDAFHKHIQTISINEKMLLTNWYSQADMDAEIAKQIYFPEQMEALNTSKHTLESSRRMQLGANVFGITMNTLVLAGGAAVGLSLAKPVYEDYKAGKSRPEALTYGIGATIYGALIGLSIYQLKNQMELQQHIAATIYKRMHPISQIFRTINKINVLMQLPENAPLLAVIENAQSLPDFYAGKNMSDSMKSLKEILLSDTFIQNDPSWRNRLGDAAAAYKLLHKVKDELVPVLMAIGSIDAYVTIAKVYAESAKNSDRFNFVEFISDVKPSLTFTGLYNPLVANAIASDVSLGGVAHNNIILTGPHGGGKSTYMKAIGYAIVLAQSFGIAPAAQATMTILDKLNTYCNIKEQLGQGHSTFMAEKKRIDDISVSLKNLSSHEKAFTLIDEPLKGTMEVEGALRVTNFLKSVCPLEQSVLIIATHFAQPAKLAQEFPLLITSAYPELLEVDTGFVRTFKILPGINEWWFNDAYKRERYIDWLTQQ